MHINITALGEYQYIQIEDELSVIAELEELYFLIDGYIKSGKKKIAVSFPDASYIYSGAIAMILKCIKKMKEHDGELCIIEPREDIKNVFAVLKLNQIIPIYESEEILLNLNSSI